jgi:hypothetical protein
MKLILLLFVTASFNCLSQNDWTKDDRNNLYEEYLGIITKYKNLTSEQKESIGLCCLDATTTKYTKKDFAAKIEIEIKRIQESVIGQCAKNIGVVLETSKIEPENVKVSSNNVFSKENLVGSWRTDKGTTITFNESGTFLKTFHENIFVGIEYMRIQGQTTSGDWFLDGSGILTLTEKWVAVETKLLKTKLWNDSANGKFKIESLTNDFLKMSLIEGKSCCNEVNKPASSITQANKVK